MVAAVFRIATTFGGTFTVTVNTLGPVAPPLLPVLPLLLPLPLLLLVVVGTPFTLVEAEDMLTSPQSGQEIVRAPAVTLSICPSLRWFAATAEAAGGSAGAT